MSFRIVHRTEYRYTGRVTLCHNEAHLTPRSAKNQRCVESAIEIEPRPNCYRERKDYFGNTVVYFGIHDPHDTLAVTATAVVEVNETAPPADVYASPPWEQSAALALEVSATGLEVNEFRLQSPLVEVDDDLADFAKPSFRPGRPLLEAVSDLNRRIHCDLTYAPRSTTVSTPLATVLRERRGVCQDFAHLAIGCLRSLGLAARYVSGYVESVPPPGWSRALGADASHAWFSVLDPVAGWVDFDPTNNQQVTDHHVTVAWGRDYSDVTPLKGIFFGGGSHNLEVSVDVIRLE